MSLSVLAVKGINLPLLEKSGSQSTLVMAHFQGYTLTSKVFDNSLNPCWNEDMLFPVGKMGVTSDDMVTIEVYTYRTDARGKLVGKCSTHASPLLTLPVITMELKLKDHFGMEQGATVICKLTYSKPPPLNRQVYVRKAKPIQQDALSVIKDTYQLRFTIHECRKLAHVPCDPVVVLTIGRATRSTQIVENSCDPVYEESIPFVMYESPFEIAKMVVNLQILNTLRNDEASLVGEFKFVFMTAFISDPIGWDEPAYSSTDTCRTMFKKWIMITHPSENPKNIKGFVSLSMSLLASGQELIAPPKIESLLLDVMANIMRPSEVYAQYQKLVIRIHRGEDITQMKNQFIVEESIMSNPRVKVGGEEKSKLVKLAYTNPYVTLSYGGSKGRTSLQYSEYNPVYMEDIIFNIEIPTICDTLMITLMDRDIEFDGIDDHIGTFFLKLDTISYRSNDYLGFDPQFGPSYLNFYGRPREISENYTKFNYLNEGWVPGVAFRGRLFVEIFTKPSYSVGVFNELTESPADSKSKVENFLNRKTFIMLFGFIEATMIEKGDLAIQFEVSIGDYGNSMSSTTQPTNSLTASSQPMFDGTKYYYCNWDDGRPVCLFPCQWEDCMYRLHTLNIMERILYRYEENLDRVQDFIQLEADEKEIKAAMKRALKDLASDCLMTLPELPPIHTNLDEKLRQLRHFKLKNISDSATDDVQNIKGNWEFYEKMCELKTPLKDAFSEPQTQVPDLLVWMISNGERVAYFKAPIHHFLFHKRNPGHACNKFRSIQLHYLGSKDDRTACLLKCFGWFGTEEEYWNYDIPSDGRITVYAETFENQTVMGTTWSIKGLSRPEFSNPDGKIALPQTAFIPPKGWEWGEDWQVSLDFSSLVTEDYNMNEYTDRIFEVDMREAGKSWSSAKKVWMNIDMEEVNRSDDMPPGWESKSDWAIDASQPGDGESWQYAIEVDAAEYVSSSKPYHYCRRRLWLRERVKVGATVIPTVAEVVAKTGGWDYAKTFQSKFHSGEMNSDIVRRRRWRRMMNSRNVGPVCFEIWSDDRQVLVPPVMVLEFPEINTYEVRAHIYQGRELSSPEVDGTINAYCVVSCWRSTAITRTIKKQLSPTWDQSFMFKGITINGNTNDVRNSLPSVTITIWHNGANADVPVGVSSLKPHPFFGENYQVSRMKWYPVYTNGKHHGDILAAFEIFQTIHGEDIPFVPPPHPSGTGLQVPPGIRPILKQTRIEVLSWGLRHLKFWSGKPIINPRLEIECGGAILVLPNIDDVLNNPNFPQTAHYFDVPLPQENNFKPPINIRLLDQRPNGFTPLVGKYVIKDFTPFDPDWIMAQLTQRKENVEDEKDSDKNSLISEEVEEKEDSIAETVVIIEDEIDYPTGCAACLSKKKVVGKSTAGQTPVTIVDETDDWEFLSMYWWSRYYAMQGDQLLYKTFLHHELPVLVVYEKEIETYFNNFSDSIQQFKLQRCPKLGGDPDDEDDEKDPDIGMYKGSFRIYELHTDVSKNRELIYGTVPTVGPIKINVRAYLLQGLRLACRSRIKENTCDPFLAVKLGSREIFDVDGSLKKNSRDPMFATFYNLTTIIPNMPQLIVQTWDWNATEEGRDILIGETRIDLENRYLSVKRPMCGLTERYMIDGPHAWRDFMSPVQILEEWCLANGIPVPTYSSDGKRVGVNGEMFASEEFEKHAVNYEDTTVWGEFKERTALYVLLEFGLIRDYVEKRQLTDPVMPGVPQGRILMWVDIFPFSEKPPEPMRVDPPLPVDQELRVIVFEVTNVETIQEIDPGPGMEKLNDLLVQGHFSGDTESQVSEIHTRAVNGNGVFNWRFKFNFQYAYLKRQVMIPGDIEDTYLDPIVTLKVMDGDPGVSREPYGYVHLNLSYMPRGMVREDWAVMDIIPEYEEPPKGKDEVYDPDDYTFVGPPKISFLNLYKAKKTLGWWPLYKKDGDYLVKTGNIRMELEVMNKEQSEKRPAGFGRNEPNANPVIPEPIRVKTEFKGLQAKLATLKFIWKSPNRCKFIIAIILQLFGFIFGALLWNAPSSLTASLAG